MQTTTGRWITHPPTDCPNGHRLARPCARRSSSAPRSRRAYHLDVPRMRPARARATEVRQRASEIHADVDLPVGIGDLVGLFAARHRRWTCWWRTCGRSRQSCRGCDGAWRGRRAGEHDWPPTRVGVARRTGSRGSVMLSSNAVHAGRINGWLAKSSAQMRCRCRRRSADRQRDLLEIQSPFAGVGVVTRGRCRQFSCKGRDE